MSPLHPAPLHTDWRRHLGIRRYPTWSSMPPRLQFGFMGLFGLLREMSQFQVDRIRPLLKAIVNALHQPGALHQLSVHDGVLLALAEGYYGWLKLLVWLGWGVSGVCGARLASRLFR